LLQQEKIITLGNPGANATPPTGAQPKWQWQVQQKVLVAVYLCLAWLSLVKSSVF
jgi:hypothetical protein